MKKRWWYYRADGKRVESQYCGWYHPEEKLNGATITDKEDLITGRGFSASAGVEKVTYVVGDEKRVGYVIWQSNGIDDVSHLWMGHVGMGRTNYIKACLLTGMCKSVLRDLITSKG